MGDTSRQDGDSCSCGRWMSLLASHSIVSGARSSMRQLAAEMYVGGTTKLLSSS
jgi:hypothetical protein